MRYLKLVFLLVLALAIVTPDADAAARKHQSGRRSGKAAVANTPVNDPRYADLIMNPVTGEVYHSNDPDGRRYPASLTKMMTLYMLFEALDQHKTTMEARLDVSDYAATMPQTNLALESGDTIPVEVAIKALVVRSANDVAVVVGEALGGDVDNFGRMMTAKARQLGMNNTVFKNPNGLPNSAQYTTARDMAKLGIALKRDFPRYYDYFNTRQFSWNGVTYYTHNRVMLRYSGTDGIKTGFTGAAGFNLVTSVTRGGRPLVGVVMGGVSGGWRDNRMIQLLDESYKQLAERGGARGKFYAANLPLSRRGGSAGIAAVANTADITTLTTKEDTTPPSFDDAEDAAPAPTGVAVGNATAKRPQQAVAVATAVVKVPASTGVSAPAPQIAKVVAIATPEPAPTPGKSQIPADSPFAMASVTPVPPVKMAAKPAVNGGWGIQVGAFSSQELAMQATKSATQLAAEPLQNARVSIAGPAANTAPVYRARLENLTQPQAKKACEKMISNNSPCFIFKVD